MLLRLGRAAEAEHFVGALPGGQCAQNSGGDLVQLPDLLGGERVEHVAGNRGDMAGSGVHKRTQAGIREARIGHSAVARVGVLANPAERLQTLHRV